MAHVLKMIDLSTQVRLPYVEQGDQSGIPVIFLHGFLDSWQSFAQVLPHLPNTIHAFALTQRGHGDSSHPVEGYSIVHFAEDLKAFMVAAHLPSAIIVGHSLGSAVAQRFAINWPERTRGLVLIGASSHLAGSPETRKFWDSTVSKLTDPVDEALVRQMTEAMIVQPVPPDVLNSAVFEGIKVPAFVWRELFESRWRGKGDFSQELGHIQAPTLIVWGDQDTRYPKMDQESLVRAIPGAQFIAYHGAGHLLHWEEPERFASDLVDFIEEIAN